MNSVQRGTPAALHKGAPTLRKGGRGTHTHPARLATPHSLFLGRRKKGLVMQEAHVARGLLHLHLRPHPTHFFWAAAKKVSLCRKHTSRVVSCTCTSHSRLRRCQSTMARWPFLYGAQSWTHEHASMVSRVEEPHLRPVHGLRFRSCTDR